MAKLNGDIHLHGYPNGARVLTYSDTFDWAEPYDEPDMYEIEREAKRRGLVVDHLDPTTFFGWIPRSKVHG